MAHGYCQRSRDIRIPSVFGLRCFPDEAPSPASTETLGVRGPDRIGDGGSLDEASVPGSTETDGARADDCLPDRGSPEQTPPPEATTAPGDSRGRLARLGDRIAELSARIQAATYELLVLIREFDEREGWDGCVSCAQWLSWRAGSRREPPASTCGWPAPSASCPS